jgi:hypothetical protein
MSLPPSIRPISLTIGDSLSSRLTFFSPPIQLQMTEIQEPQPAHLLLVFPGPQPVASDEIQHFRENAKESPRVNYSNIQEMILQKKKKKKKKKKNALLTLQNGQWEP